MTLEQCHDQWEILYRFTKIFLTAPFLCFVHPILPLTLLHIAVKLVCRQRLDFRQVVPEESYEFFTKFFRTGISYGT